MLFLHREQSKPVWVHSSTSLGGSQLSSLYVLCLANGHGYYPRQGTHCLSSSRCITGLTISVTRRSPKWKGKTYSIMPVAEKNFHYFHWLRSFLYFKLISQLQFLLFAIPLGVITYGYAPMYWSCNFLVLQDTSIKSIKLLKQVALHCSD